VVTEGNSDNVEMVAANNGVGPGDVGPDFALESSEGGKVRLSEFRDRSVLLYFMREFT
jgi:peroxiredoxin